MQEEKEMRLVYAETLLNLAEKDPAVVVLEADLMKASGMALFKERFPERTFDFGVAEANMIGAAAGLSAGGKIPFAHTFACFITRRAYDQIFVSGAYAQQNLKLIGSDPGIAATLNGGTHMPFEDAGIMRNIPGMVVFEPGDPVSLAALTEEMYRHRGCCYMRLFRKPAKVLYGGREKFALGKGNVLREGRHCTLIAAGVIPLGQALQAAQLLEKEGISAAVLDMHTIKPLDEALVITYARKTGAVLTCENHQIVNGLGSAVAEVIAEKCRVPFLRCGIEDAFGEVGELDYLLQRYKLDAASIAQKARNLLSAKNTERPSPGL